MKKLYQMTLLERLNYINETYDTNYTIDSHLLPNVLEAMIENSITSFPLPLGIVENFKVNNRIHTIPMVTEEASVVAALNKANKIIDGKMNAKVLNKLLIGQIIFHNPLNKDKLTKFINDTDIIQLGSTIYSSIYKRQGGITSFKLYETSDITDSFIVLEISVDTKEAMGANIVNHLCEGIATYIQTNTNETALMSILTNNSTSLVEAHCEIDIETLINKEETAHNIEAASKFAKINTSRAVTNNKGVMNGIEAVIIATGNDTRAVSANVHAYASIKGTYTSLTNWTIQDNKLIGTITLPLSIGTVGGSIKTNPIITNNMKLINVANVYELMEVIASVGLAQNFAALYALVTEGIQKGHMNLHLKNLAHQLNANDEELAYLQNQLQNKRYNQDMVKELLTVYRKNKK